MKTETKFNPKTDSESGYTPKIELSTGTYSVNYFYQNSAVKNTTAEIMKNKTIIISNSIKN